MKTSFSNLADNGSVDGQWSEWGAWSACTETCGGGTQTRTRLCNNPAPSNGGSDCTGDSQQSQACNTDACNTGNMMKIIMLGYRFLFLSKMKLILKSDFKIFLLGCKNSDVYSDAQCESWIWACNTEQWNGFMTNHCSKACGFC